MADPRTAKAASHLGANLAAWRKMLDLTAQQVAERADISRKTLSRLENGAPVSTETLLAVCRSLGMADRIIEASDPWKTDLGRLRAEGSLPERVRHRG